MLANVYQFIINSYSLHRSLNEDFWAPCVLKQVYPFSKWKADMFFKYYIEINVLALSVFIALAESV